MHLSWAVVALSAVVGGRLLRRKTFGSDRSSSESVAVGREILQHTEWPVKRWVIQAVQEIAEQRRVEWPAILGARFSPFSWTVDVVRPSSGHQLTTEEDHDDRNTPFIQLIWDMAQNADLPNIADVDRHSISRPRHYQYFDLDVLTSVRMTTETAWARGIGFVRQFVPGSEEDFVPREHWMHQFSECETNAQLAHQIVFQFFIHFAPYHSPLFVIVGSRGRPQDLAFRWWWPMNSGPDAMLAQYPPLGLVYKKPGPEYADLG